MKWLSLFLLIPLSGLHAQRVDTLTFFSQAFQKERSVYVHVPEFYKYQSDQVQLPVIYLLDGQHEWFINPVLSTIRYLQYTHEMPQALVVVLPLENRNQECAIQSVEGAPLPLHSFLINELEIQLKKYYPNNYRMLIGHSFSASFALYARLLSPDIFSSVIAHTPLDELEGLVQALQKQNRINGICLSVGGIAKDKDFYHRSAYDDLKQKYPDFFSRIRTFESNHSAHNAVPIVATPYFLTEMFSDFCSRYSSIAEVNEEYQLKQMPNSVREEIEKIQRASVLGDYFYPPEIPDLNGLASRYLSSGADFEGRAVYEMGIAYFPHYFEFHWGLYEWYREDDSQKAKYHLMKALQCVETYEAGAPDQQELLDELRNECAKNGW